MENMATVKKPSTPPIKPGSIVARRGGRPAQLLKGGSQLSSRQERKAALANHFDSKAERRK
jgi:hypothetical protein